MTRIVTAGQSAQVSGQLALDGMPARLYPCTPSRLLTFLDCPRRYRMTYLDRPSPPRRAWAHLSVGASTHTALAQWWTLPLERRTPAAGAELVRQAWSDKGFRDSEQSALARGRASQWVATYLQGTDPQREPIGVERTVATPTATMTISGRVDRIDLRTAADGTEHVVIVDYKTGRRAPSDDDARTSLQLALYAVAAARTLRRASGQVELHHLPSASIATARHDEAALSRRVSEAASIARDCARADEAFRRDGAEASAEHFAPQPSPGCSMCDMRSLCREGQAAAPEIEPWALLAW